MPSSLPYRSTRSLDRSAFGTLLAIAVLVHLEGLLQALLKHPTKPGRVTVPGKLGDDLAPGTLNSILKQSGLKKLG